LGCILLPFIDISEGRFCHLRGAGCRKYRAKKCRIYLAKSQQYISDIDVRRIISVATNKSERFNQFADFLLFGGKGIIAENVRDEQRKVIKYNHLVANLVILHTLVTMSEALQNMVDDGHDIDQEALACFSPYQTEHINRFGEYEFRSGQEMMSMEPALNITFLDDVMVPSGF